MKRFPCKLLCLILALMMVIGCFAGCDNTSGGRDRGNDDQEETEKEDIRDTLEKYEINGLTYYLSDDFGDDDDSASDSACHESDDATITVACGPMTDISDDDITSSKAFAEYFMELTEDMYDEVKVDSANGVFYTLGTYEETATLIGFYVQDGYGWMLMAETDNEDLVENLTQYVTLGQIDKNFDAGDYISSDDDYEDYEDIEIEVNPSYDTFTVHAYVPEGWGYPGCWAWSNTTGENVFDAWPGEPMDHVSGYYYTLKIPVWAEYVIVNGNDGTIQTDDEPVEAGSDIWIIIGTAGDYYGVFFEEPDAATLSEYGY